MVWKLHVSDAGCLHDGSFPHWSVGANKKHIFILAWPPVF